MQMQALNIPLYTEAEFLNVVREFRDVTMEELMNYGFTAWDKDRPAEFFKQIFSYSSGVIPYTYIVDVGDAKFVWLVSGSSSIVIAKDNFTPTIN